MPGWAVMIELVVITSRTSFPRCFSKRRSRFFRIPTRRDHGRDHRQTPDTVALHHRERVGDLLFGMNRDGIGDIAFLSYFLTAATSAAWRSTERLRWMKPRPPPWAIAIAARNSVTVSIQIKTRGMRKTNIGREQSRDVAAGGEQVGSLRQQQNVVEGEPLAKTPNEA